MVKFLDFLGRSKPIADDSGKTWRHTRGYKFDIVGEGSYQKNISRICGGKREYGVKHECVALLIPENRDYGPAVRVDIKQKTVGYLSRDNVSEYLDALKAHNLSDKAVSARAKIIGGWKRRYFDETDEQEKLSEGHFGVKLNMRWPPEIAKN